MRAALLLAFVAGTGCCLDALQEEQALPDAGPGFQPDASLIIAPIGSDAGAPPIACTAYAAPPLPTACPSPSVAAGGSLALPTAQPVSSWALATDGAGEASFAFILGVTTDSLPWRVYLQRLSPGGVLLGPLNEIDLPEWGPLVALAASPVSHVLCWEDSSTTIACAAMPVGGGPVYPGLTVGGQLPAVAYGPAGFLFAYVATDGSVTVQPLDCSARSAGAPTVVAGLTADAVGLAASSTGYALVTGTAEGEGFAQFLSASGTPQGAPVVLANGFGSGSSLALSGGILASPGGLHDSSGPVASDASCAAAGGLDLFAPAAGATFGSLCVSQAGFGGQWLGGAPLPDDLGDTAILLSSVPDGFLLATFGSEVGFAHLGCP